ncbi:MAG: MMPL family transporter [Anaerolineae bacterium]|nr:MMPL family transporter [Anaerolineae bacterium]
MFFERIGHWATHYRIPIIVAWVAAAIIITVVAPNIEEVASSDTADFLPSDAPFAFADDVYTATFGSDNATSSTIILFDAREKAGGIFNQDAATFEEKIDTEIGHFLDELGAWLNSDAVPEGILSADYPTMAATAAELMVASDSGDDPTLANQVALVRVALAYSPTNKESEVAIAAIDDWLDEHLPADVQAYQTGAAPLVLNTTSSVKTSVDRTIWVTVVLVIIMLLVVYRSPVSPLIPLSAVTVAYLITRGIVAYMGEHYMTITSYANVMLVVVMYGAGTDYCLFLISRFREEMADHPGVESATAHTVHRVGETITSSAGTIFVGFMAMIFAEMGIFNTSGPALALGIIMSLGAGLTLVPALLATLGNRAFWPGEATHRDNGRLYELTSKWVSTYPLPVILVIVLLMLPVSLYGVNQRVTYELLADLPDDLDVVKGYELMSDSLGAGNVMPTTIVVTERAPDQIAADIVHLTDELVALEGVYDVRGLDDPAGQHSPDIRDLLHVSTQLNMALDIMNASGADTETMIGPEALTAMLRGLNGYLDLLAEQFPAVTDDPNMIALQEILSNPLQLALRQAEIAPAFVGLAERFSTMDEAYLMPTAFSDILAALPAAVTEGDNSVAMLNSLSETYLAKAGTAFKLELIFAVSPSSYEAMDTMHAIRDILTRYEGDGEAVAGGGTAVNTDIRDTMDRDLLRAIGFVLLGIFIVLLLMLRSVIAPLYLIGTVVLSFTFTLGLTNFVFKTLMDVDGLTWYVPFFAFVFLVALGIDYSIFLFGRIKEEVGHHGLREGVHVAVATTGAIITSAGIILSGTFAAMITGEVAGLKELGFAVAVGVLIDTFVVRTVLDPALATLFGKWTWWPGGVPQAQPRPDRELQPAPESGD